MAEQDDSNEDPYSNDESVEQTMDRESVSAPPKRRKTDKKTKIAQTKTRAHLIEQDTSQIKDQLATLMHQLSAHFTHAPTAEEDGSVRGHAPLSEVPGLNGCNSVVPGDGDCLWHACATWSVAGSATKQDPIIG